MARPKKTYQCYACKMTFTFEKGYANDGGLFVKDDFKGSVRKVEVISGKIHYCTGAKADNISGDSQSTPVPTPYHETPYQPEPVQHVQQPVYQAEPLTDLAAELSPAGAEIFKLIEPALRKKLAEIVKNLQQTITHVVEIKTPVTVNVITGAHAQLAELLEFLACRKNVLLVGPAGTGKSTAARYAADALGLAFYPLSVGPQTSKSDFFGFTDAQGRPVWTVIRKAFVEGGLLLIDELDAAGAGSATYLNALLANGECVFPADINDTDKVTVEKKHPDFRVVACANTYGLGANRMYVGRNQLDAATLDRFVGLDWDYDTDLECRIGETQPEWVTFVWALRAAQNELGIRAVFGTRKIIDGTDLLNAGISLARVSAATVWFGVSADDKSKLLAKMGRS